MAILPQRPKGLKQREAIDLPTTAPPLYSTAKNLVKTFSPQSKTPRSGQDARGERVGFGAYRRRPPGAKW